MNTRSQLFEVAAAAAKQADEAYRAANPRYRIWATDHNGWWRHHRCGYTTKLHEAGEYTGAEIAEVLADDMLNEQRVCMVGEEEVMAARIRHEGKK